MAKKLPTHLEDAIHADDGRVLYATLVTDLTGLPPMASGDSVTLEHVEEWSDG